MLESINIFGDQIGKRKSYWMLVLFLRSRHMASPFSAEQLTLRIWPQIFMLEAGMS